MRGPGAECRFEIQLNARAPGGAWCQCATHGGSGPARCGAVAAELERRFSLGAALITAGAPGEAALWEHQVGTVLVRQMPDDPAALRVSLGQPHQPGDQPGSPGRGAAYLVFRGDPGAWHRLPGGPPCFSLDSMEAPTVQGVRFGVRNAIIPPRGLTRPSRVGDGGEPLPEHPAGPDVLILDRRSLHALSPTVRPAHASAPDSCPPPETRSRSSHQDPLSGPPPRRAPTQCMEHPAMPDRMIREKARRSRSLKNLSDAAERAWWRLTVTCDDYGRFDADAELLVAQLFERRPRSWTAEKMAKAIVEWTQSFADAPQPLVHLYQRPDDEALYGHIVSFMDHQRERDSKPKYPDPPCGGKTEDAAKCRDSRHIGGNLPQLAAEGNAPGSASRGEPPQLAAGRGEPLQLAARAETGSGGRKAESGSGAGAGAGEGKGGVGGRGNGVDPDLKVTLLATKHLQPLADDRHADLWTSLEKAYDAYPWLFFEEEVAKADAWCESHPARRPTPRGLPAFMRNWLDKAVEIGRKQHREAQA